MRGCSFIDGEYAMPLECAAYARRLDPQVYTARDIYPKGNTPIAALFLVTKI